MNTGEVVYVLGALLAVVVVGLLALGWLAIDAGGRWSVFYRDLTLVLMGGGFSLLVFGIRAGNRALLSLAFCGPNRWTLPKPLWNHVV